MSAQPVHHASGPRVPVSIDGIAQALPSPAERMAFYREIGPLEDQVEREAAITSWWTKAMSAAYGPDRAGFRAAVSARIADTRRPLPGDAGE
ncbi:hypothetical protein ACFVHB_36185 [Kitasatospora sp. NPDC127111]|uniref:hypothetical protein n=1 Tax=Kitasatospora sp. NPDC127111 TaxID=3345363 RepID=UPI00363BDFC1